MTRDDILTLPVLRETRSDSRIVKNKHNRITVHQAPDGKFWWISRAFVDDVEVERDHTIIEVKPVTVFGETTYHEVR